MRFINFGNEAIAFQSPEFADKMTSLIDDILAERNGKSADNSKAAKDLNKLVKDVTGLNVNIIFDTEYPPCTLPFHFNPDTVLGHVSLKEYYIEDYEKTVERLKKVKTTSSIDLKNAKVTGIFSVPVVPIFMGFFSLMRAKLKPREIAAILAHEIGHCFTGMELAFRTARTNQILSAVSKAHASGDKGKYVYVIKNIEEVLSLKTGVLDEALEAKDGATALVITMGEIEKKTHEDSILGNTAYDVTSFEALSDNFAARLGFGKDLATGLEKIYKTFNAAEYSIKTRIIITLFDFASFTNLLFAFKVITGAIKVSNPVMTGIMLGLTLLNIYRRLDGRDHNNIYDNLTTRYKRIKEQIITYIKDAKLPPKETKKALESIAHIENMMKEVSEYKGFLPILFNQIDPASRASLKAKDIQGKLEMLAANDLYVQAAKIRTLES